MDKAGDSVLLIVVIFFQEGDPESTITNLLLFILCFPRTKSRNRYNTLILIQLEVLHNFHTGIQGWCPAKSSNTGKIYLESTFSLPGGSEP